jgi:two-component system cell cycle sensor histidine kinase PleC
MTAQPIAPPAHQTGEAERMLRARLDFIAASLPTTVWINPVWAILGSIPFTGLFPIFNAVPLWRLAAAVMLQIANGVLALMLYRSYRAGVSSVNIWLARLTVLQALIGTAWGMMAWLLWIKGDEVNNVMVALTVVGILWAYAMSRTMHMTVYLAAVLPTAGLAFARFALSAQGDAWGLEYVVLVTFLCTMLLALAAKRQFETMLATRFSNEDLAMELRRAHDEALRKRFEAEAANASKTTFLANMSHELRTPLNAILGFSDIIANERLGGVGTPRYKEYASDINTSGSHLLSIINDILDIAKIESGKMEIEPRAIDPREAISNAVKVAGPRARERHQQIVVDMAPDTPRPFADERALKQIVINLTSNAVKFTQEGGKVVIRCRRAGGDFELCVEDNGPGIAPELLERVFSPFNQIDNRYNRQAGGTGLGLSLVRGLAQLHGGDAWIESELGHGVRAFVRFPIASEEAAAPAKMRAQA